MVSSATLFIFTPVMMILDDESHSVLPMQTPHFLPFMPYLIFKNFYTRAAQCVVRIEANILLREQHSTRAIRPSMQLDALVGLPIPSNTRLCDDSNNKRQAYVQAAVTGGADEKVASLIIFPRPCIVYDRSQML